MYEPVIARAEYYSNLTKNNSAINETYFKEIRTHVQGRFNKSDSGCRESYAGAQLIQRLYYPLSGIVQSEFISRGCVMRVNIFRRKHERRNGGKEERGAHKRQDTKTEEHLRDPASKECISDER